VMILTEPLGSDIITDQSFQSSSFGVEFGISDIEQRETVGAIKHVIVVGKGYFQRQAQLLAAIENS
jgi:hypothetical protein